VHAAQPVGFQCPLVVLYPPLGLAPAHVLVVELFQSLVPAAHHETRVGPSLQHLGLTDHPSFT
jgi:hypothetical protein